jgi:glycerol uptake facilitator-like aquaporin
MAIPQLPQKLLAECLGTFAVTFGAMSVDIAYFSGDDVGNVSRWLARGFITAAAIYTLSEISGAHFNPVVTLAFLLRRSMPLALGGYYLVAQIAGAFGASASTWLLFGNRFGLGASHPGRGVSGLTAVCIEMVLTAIVLVNVLITANEAVVGKDVALAVGFSIAACGLFGGRFSGASMNPARSIVPQLLSGQADLAWIYVVGPVGGTLLAVATAYLLCGSPSAHEAKAAHGE